MDTDLIKAFAIFHSETKKRNNLFNRKAHHIISVRDSFYAYALDKWTHIDELYKYKLALEIHGWIEESGRHDDLLGRRLLPLIMSELGRCALDENTSNQAIALVMIKCELGRFVVSEQTAKMVLLQNLTSCRNTIAFQLSKMLGDPVHSKIFKNVFDRLIFRLDNERDFYQKLSDGSYWEELAEKIECLESSVKNFLTEKIEKLENIIFNDASEAYISRMEHVSNELSKLFSRCTSILGVAEEVRGNKDTFAVNLLLYCAYNEYLTGVKQIVPSWIHVHHINVRKDSSSLANCLGHAPGSPLFWFYVLALEVSKTSNTVPNSEKQQVILDSINTGISGNKKNHSVLIKYVNTNLPVGNEATTLLADNILTLVEDKLSLESSLEYSYYLACLNEPYGLTKNKKSWFKKHTYGLFKNSKSFVGILYRIYLGLEFKRRKKEISEIQDDASWNGEGTHDHAYNISLDNLHDETEQPDLPLVHTENFKLSAIFSRNILVQKSLDIDDEFLIVSNDSLHESLKAYLQYNELSSLTSAEYVLSALEHYLEIQTQNLPHRNPVWINGTLWSKIRRGKVRLLVRIDGDDIIIHAYKRKEYHPKMFDK